MRTPGLPDLALLQQLVSLQADLARSDIARAQAQIEQLKTALDALEETPVRRDPIAVAAATRWFQWRHERKRRLLEDLSLAHAHLERVIAQNAPAIAREDAIALLVRDAKRDTKRAAQARALENLALTSPGGQYR